MDSKKDLLMQNKVFLLVAMITLVILSIPAIAMRFTNEVNWGLEDFIAVTILVFGMGSLFVIVARIVPRKYRAITAVIFLLALLTLWVHLAVGIVDTWPFAGS